MSIDIVADEWDLELPEDSGRLIQDDPVSVSDSGMGDGRRDGGGVGCGRVFSFANQYGFGCDADLRLDGSIDGAGQGDVFDWTDL